jgi:hypothetical protein
MVPYYKWEDKAVYSLLALTIASAYSAMECYSKFLFCVALAIGAICGCWSLYNQHRAGMAQKIEFDDSDWFPLDSEWELRIESDIMLFRVELKSEDGRYEEVFGGVKTSADGRTTYLIFSKSAEVSRTGRIVTK